MTSTLRSQWSRRGSFQSFLAGSTAAASMLQVRAAFAQSIGEVREGGEAWREDWHRFRVPVRGGVVACWAR